MVVHSLGNSARHSANAFLRSLSVSDAALIAPFLTETRMKAGEALGADGRAADMSIYFPLTLVANANPGTEHGGGLIGREGLIGWAAVLGRSQTGHSATALLDGGTALALPVRRMRVACFASSTLLFSLLKFVQAYSIQLSCLIRSSDCATLIQRLSALLLMLHDRIDGDRICVTHQALAWHLHVRRASVTDLLHLLEGDRILRCGRRSIAVRDRRVLEASAGLAYGTAEQAYRDLVGPFGKIGTPHQREDRRSQPCDRAVAGQLFA